MGSENICGLEMKNNCGRAIGHGLCDPRFAHTRAFVVVILKCSHACFVFVMLEYGPDSHISIISWRQGCGARPPRAVACAFASEPQPPPNSKMCPREQAGNKTPQPCCRHGQKLHVHPCCRPPVLSPARRKRNKIRSLSSVTVSSIVEVTIDNQRSAPGSAALELQRSKAPGAPVKTTPHMCCVSNIRRAKPEQQWRNEKRINAYRTVESNRKPIATRPLASSTSSRKEKHNNQKEKVI